MDKNLPPVLPAGVTGSHNTSGPVISARRNAQDLSVSQTQQQKDTENAAVSINQMMSGKPSARPTTSVYRATHGDSDAVTSVARQDQEQHSIYGEETKGEAEAREYRRYSYVKKLIKARKDEEAKEQKAAEEKQGFKAGIGKTYRSSGVTSFKRRFKTHLRKNRATYKNISKKDAELLTNIVEKTLGPKPTGSSIKLRDRKKMKMKAWKEYKKGEITKEDVKDFRKIVGQLD